MSEHMHSMTPGQSLEMKGPIPKYPWEANKHDHIALIAGGTGITPMYQLARAIFKNPEDKTKVTLVYGNVTADDQRFVDEDQPAYSEEAAADRSDRADRSDPAEKPSFFDRLLGDRTREVTVPPGTTVMLRWSETVSSRASAPGDSFRTTVDEDVTVDEAVAIPAGSVILGRVTEAHQPKVGGRARLALEFTSVELP